MAPSQQAWGRSYPPSLLIDSRNVTIVAFSCPRVSPPGSVGGLNLMATQAALAKLNESQNQTKSQESEEETGGKVR